MLNPGGRSLIVTIGEAFLYLGVDISRPGHLPEITPEEKRLRRKERRRPVHEQREAER